MRRKIRLAEKLLLAGLSFILLFLLLHDWAPLGPFNVVEAVANERALHELLLVTMIGVVQIAFLLFGAHMYR